MKKASAEKARPSRFLDVLTAAAIGSVVVTLGYVGARFLLSRPGHDGLVCASGQSRVFGCGSDGASWIIVLASGLIILGAVVWWRLRR